jgi:hypothetical protein
MTGDAGWYLAGRIEQALAADPRINELGVRADVQGDVVVLRGEVAGEQRRRLIAEVAGDAAPGHQIRNEVSVSDLGPVGQEEML